ncbi:MAG TPA: hypothetical protein VFG30_06500 [Polyangiales bacterium]|nr:hypothetical protein [Polyangiales bacterium]
MFQRSVIGRTGQSWKLGAGLLLMVFGFAVMILGLQRLEAPNGFAITLSGIGAGLGAAALACLAIRCPSCRMRWLWAAVKNEEQLQWVNWLRAQRACPRCGYNPSAINPPPP